MGRKLRSLFVTLHGSNLNPTIEALEKSGFEAWWSWERVESGGKLPEVLERDDWDVVIYDPRCIYEPEWGLSLEILRDHVKRHAPKLPIVVAVSLDTLGDEVKRVLDS